ncbi:MAG: efflux RND transporter periplasmic adaptor subunit [Deltaproteobacteria bacterium]|nr:efflux RND transporter periplasmic adaptor subunit [Deltaproteobacteria bacterium]
MTHWSKMIAVMIGGPGLALAAAGAGCSSQAQSRELVSAGAATGASASKPMLPEVHTVAPERVRHRPSYVATGTLMPVNDAPLGFKLGGRLARIAVQRGQSVRKGDLLLQLDTQDVLAGVAQAEAAHQAAEAQAAMARDGLERLNRLQQSGVATEQQLTQARFQVQMAEAQLAQAEAALQNARNQLDNHSLRAPFDGTVLNAPDSIGVMVGPGTPLVEVATLTCLRLQATLPSDAAGRIEVGAQVPLEHSRGTVNGKVTRVMPALEPRGHRLPVEAELCGEEAKGLANAFVKARFTAQAETDAYKVPVTSLERREEPGLFLVGSDGQACHREVTILARERGWVVVAGLSDGDRVIDQPPDDLQDGAGIRLASSADAL